MDKHETNLFKLCKNKYKILVCLQIIKVCMKELQTNKNDYVKKKIYIINFIGMKCNNILILNEINNAYNSMVYMRT